MTVPILGQPFSVLGYLVVPTLKCHCDVGGVVTLVVQSSEAGFLKTQGICSACKRTFTVAGFSATAEGQMQFAVEMSMPAPSLVTQ